MKMPTMRHMLMLGLAAVAAAGLALGGRRMASADPVDFPPVEAAQTRLISEDHSGDVWCAIRAAVPEPSASRGRPVRPGVLEAGHTMTIAPFTPPFPCQDRYVDEFQGLLRFDMSQLTRRGYAASREPTFRASLTFRRAPASPALPNVDDPDCDDRELLIEPVERGATWVTRAVSNLWAGVAATPVRFTEQLAELRSGDASFSVDVTRLVEGWLRGEPNDGISLRLGWSLRIPLFLHDSDIQPHGWLTRRCVQSYTDFALHVASTIGAPIPEVSVQTAVSGSVAPLPRQMTLHGHVYAGRIGASEFVPAGTEVRARNPLTGATCSDPAPVRKDGTYELNVRGRSSAEPGCFNAGDVIQLTAGGIVQRHAVVTFTAGADVAVDVGAF